MNNSNNRIYAFFSYLPFIGWIVPMGLKKNDRFVISHAKQGFLLAAIFTLLPIMLFLTDIAFVPADSKIVKYVFNLAIYASHIIYFVFCIFGMLTVKNNKFVLVPVIKKYYNKLDF